ncbi:MAG: hypothetical protein WKF75_11015 [Singulisphaera sp.]
MSLLSPSLQVLDAAGVVKAMINNTGKSSTRQTVAVSGLVAGATYYLKVDGTEATALGTGAYSLSMNFSGLAAPEIAPPLTSVSNGSPLSSGGGEAARVDLETRVNTQNQNVQSFSPDDSKNVAVDSQGNYVIVWTSGNQDYSGDGVYARRFNAAGSPLGAEFRVNVYTANEQTDPTVAMAHDGSFLVAWASQPGRLRWGVYARRYDAAGPAGGEFRVSTHG